MGLSANRILRGATDLELTEDQIKDLEKLSYDTQLQLIDLESDLEKAQLEMKRLMEDGSDDTSAMKKQLRSLSEKRLGIQETKLENWNFWSGMPLNPVLTCWPPLERFNRTIHDKRQRQPPGVI